MLFDHAVNKLFAKLFVTPLCYAICFVAKVFECYLQFLVYDCPDSFLAYTHNNRHIFYICLLQIISTPLRGPIYHY